MYIHACTNSKSAIFFNEYLFFAYTVYCIPRYSTWHRLITYMYLIILAVYHTAHAWTQTYSEWFLELHVVGRDEARESAIEQVLPGYCQHKANPLLSPEFIQKLSSLSEHGNLETKTQCQASMNLEIYIIQAVLLCRI